MSKNFFKTDDLFVYLISPGSKAVTPSSPRGEKEPKSPSVSPTEIREKKAEEKEAEVVITPPENDLEKLTDKLERPR